MRNDLIKRLEKLEEVGLENGGIRCMVLPPDDAPDDVRARFRQDVKEEEARGYVVVLFTEAEARA